MSYALPVAVVVLLGATVALGFYARHLRWMNGRQANELAWYKNLIQTHNGWSASFGSYNIVSFDGEKWFNYETTKSEPIETPYGYRGTHRWKITGETDPAVVRHVLGTAALCDHIHKRGPIDPFDPHDREIAEKAGFTFSFTGSP